MKKLLIYIIILAIIIGLGIAVGLNMEDEEKQAIQTSTKKTENKVENKIENIVENTVNNKEENIENTIQNNNEENKVQDEEEKTDKSRPLTDLDKAIDLVKEEWGTENGVYFAQDGKTDEGEYIICVRDSRTTNALAWYKVNIETGTCEEW